MDIPTSRTAGLWRNRDFVKLWIGQTASQLAAQGSQVILPLVAVIGLGAGTHQLGALRAAQQAPVLLFSLFAGVWADRRQARDLMVLADVGRLLVLAAVPVAYVLGALDLPVLVVVAFAAGTCTVCFDVAYQAALPRLIERDRLPQGNSLLEASRSAAQIAGPAVGGGLMSMLSGPVAVVVAASFFALSSLSIARIRHRASPPARTGPRSSTPRQIRDGIRFVARDALLRTVGLAACVYQFCFAALMTTYLFFLPHTLRLSGVATGIALAGPGSFARPSPPWTCRDG